MIHSLDQRYRHAIKSWELEYWMQGPQKSHKAKISLRKLTRKAAKARQALEVKEEEEAWVAEAAKKGWTVRHAKRIKNAEELEKAWDLYYQRKSSENIEQASKAREARVKARCEAREAREAVEEAEEAEKARSARVLRKR